MTKATMVKFIPCVLSLAVALSTGSSMESAQRAQQPSVAALDVQKLTDSVYVIKGGGGNSTIFVGSKGVVLVDAKTPGWGAPLLEKIKTITDKPVIVLINTHSHADHTSGNVEMPAGVEIIASENTKKNMEDMDFFKKPENAKGLPTKTFKDKMTLFSGADEVDLYWFGPGETSGDTYVVFPSAHVVVAEDQFPSQTMHIVNTAAGGSAVKFPDTLAKAVATIKGVDTVVTGHDGVLTFDDLKLWTQFQREFLSWSKRNERPARPWTKPPRSTKFRTVTRIMLRPNRDASRDIFKEFTMNLTGKRSSDPPWNVYVYS